MFEIFIFHSFYTAPAHSLYLKQQGFLVCPPPLPSWTPPTANLNVPPEAAREEQGDARAAKSADKARWGQSRAEETKTRSHMLRRTHTCVLSRMHKALAHIDKGLLWVDVDTNEFKINKSLFFEGCLWRWHVRFCLSLSDVSPIVNGSRQKQVSHQNKGKPQYFCVFFL